MEPVGPFQADLKPPGRPPKGGGASTSSVGRLRWRTALGNQLLELDLVPLPLYVDPGLRDRYVNGLRTAGLEG